MKIGIFGDIHGNRLAFEEIHTQLKNESCDLHIFLGDVCGYYYRQNDIIEMLRNIPHLHAVIGNHDAAFLEAIDNEMLLKDYSEHFGRSFELLKDNITDANLEFLKSLPQEILLPSHNIAAYHGSPWKPLSEYIYPNSPLDRFDELPFDIVFLGHTHYPMDRKSFTVRVINPGSAGQPRDGGWPSYAVYDTETKIAEIKRVPYDVSTMIHVVEVMNEDKIYLVEVLQRINS